jgi:hypothetical protein
MGSMSPMTTVTSTSWRNWTRDGATAEDSHPAGRGDNWPILLGLIFLCAFALGDRRRRRSVQRDILPRKGRLEALLKELDG